jgi:hypothetical protein
VGMVLAGHEFGRTFTDSLRDPAAQEATMVQKKLQQVQVRAAELAAQREVVAQPRVQVLDQRARARCLRHGPFVNGAVDAKNFGFKSAHCSCALSQIVFFPQQHPERSAASSFPL